MKLSKKFKALFGKKKLDAEMAEEMRLHLERRVEENIATGMSPEEARYAAQREFGGVEQVKEIVREQRSWVWLEQLLQDVRYACRQLARAKGFTAVVVVTLALGIGATTAIYSVVNTLLFHPVPGDDAGRLVQIGEHAYYGYETKPTPKGMSPPVFEALQASSGDLIEELARADTDVSFERKGDDFVTSVAGCLVSPNFFPMLGAQPLLGRTFVADEAVPRNYQTRLLERDAPIVLSYGGWKTLFGGRRDVLGQAIDLSGRRFTVVGVMPEWFQFPYSGMQFWVPAEPLRVPPNHADVGNMRVIARLKPGVEATQLQTMLDTLAERLSADATHAWMWKRSRAPSGLGLWSSTLQAALSGRLYGSDADQVKRMLLGLMAAIGFLLLIVCANVANLMLARTERRLHELAVRAALGAGRPRLTRQLLTESVLLATLGGVGGLIMTSWAMKLLIALNTMPRLRPIEVDGRALGFSLLISLMTAVAFGLVPAWRGARPHLSATLSQGSAASTPASSGRRYRRALVIVQVALAVVLLTGAGLMVQSVVRLLRVDPGFDPESLVMAIPPLPDRLRRLDSPIASRNQFFDQVRERFSAVPGVVQVGLWKNGGGGTERITLEGRAEPIEVFRGNTGVGERDYFRVARVPLLKGRYLESQDAGEGGGGIVINETMARWCWPGEPALGKKFRTKFYLGNKARDQVCEVVGVVADVRTYQYDEVTRPIFFRPMQEAELTGMPITMVVRTNLEPAQVIPLLRDELKVLEPGLRMPLIEIAGRALYESTLPRRTYRNYLGVFAVAGLFLSALGVYGVLTYSVARRTREIGIRIAVGAERHHVTSMVLWEGVRMVGAGFLFGLVAAFWLTRLLQKQLFGVSPHDPMVLAGVVCVLAAVALIACWLPARRAARVDPMVALRSE